MPLKAIDAQPTSVQQVTEQILGELKQGAWPVGHRLPSEAALAQQLSVSRTVVREAIRGLANLGMLEPRHGSGTFVRTLHSPEAMLSTIDRATIVEVYEVQMAYDVQAADLAARNRSEGDLRRLRRLLAERARSEGDRSDPGRFATDDANFHLEVAAMSHNALLHETYRYFFGRLQDSLSRAHADARIPTCGHDAHAAIVAAIAAQDVDAARRAAHDVVATAIASIT